jgi:hypothetical protein
MTLSGDKQRSGTREKKIKVGLWSFMC